MNAYVQKIKFDAIFIGVIFFSILDRLLKSLFILYKSLEFKIIPGFIYSRFEANHEIAFSLKVIHSAILPWLILTLIFFLILLFFYTFKKKRLNESMLILCIIFGSANNLFDRFKYGFVIDYLCLNRLFIFNLSDVLIVFGSFGLIWIYFKK